MRTNISIVILLHMSNHTPPPPVQTDTCESMHQTQLGQYGATVVCILQCEPDGKVNKSFTSLIVWIWKNYFYFLPGTVKANTYQLCVVNYPIKFIISKKTLYYRAVQTLTFTIYNDRAILLILIFEIWR